MGRDVELQNTQIVLFKSSRDVLQTKTLSQQLSLGSQEWYQDVTSTPYGHLLLDLTPKTVDSLKYCTTMSIQYVSILEHYFEHFHKKSKNKSSSIAKKVSFNSSANV